MSNLPAKVQQDLDAYIERIKAIKWFKPKAELDKGKIEKQVNIALDCFGVKAGIEYKKLEIPKDWGAARDAAWGAARDAARGAAWGAAWDAAWDAAWGASEIVSEDLEAFTKKYPKGAFLQLIPLWEEGLYPIGIVDGKFLIYIPPFENKFPELK